MLSVLSVVDEFVDCEVIEIVLDDNVDDWDNDGVLLLLLSSSSTLSLLLVIDVLLLLKLRVWDLCKVKVVNLLSHLVIYIFEWFFIESLWLLLLYIVFLL